MGKPEGIDEICSHPTERARLGTRGHAPAIYPSSVYACSSPAQAIRLLAGEEPGYVYQRDGHPNADDLADKLCRLHRARWAVVTSCGMSALGAVVMSELRSGDHVIASQELYGRTLRLLTQDLARWGVATTVVERMEIEQVRSAWRKETRMVVAETITNPLLQLAPLPDLAQLTRARQATLLVDNTFATPFLCQPLEWGATLVVESVSKMLNGHSDVMLGMVVGAGDEEASFRQAMSTWGFTSSPFDCWLASRGLSTFPLRMARANQNAATIAPRLQAHRAVKRVDFPGLAEHPQHALAQTLFAGRGFGSLVTFELAGGENGVDRWIAASTHIPFCPSLGEVATTVSHPLSTSHRSMPVDIRERLGIQPGTLRLSLGTEEAETIWSWLAEVLDQVGS